jgi:hypothetical protein
MMQTRPTDRGHTEKNSAGTYSAKFGKPSFPNCKPLRDKDLQRQGNSAELGALPNSFQSHKSSNINHLRIREIRPSLKRGIPEFFLESGSPLTLGGSPNRSDARIARLIDAVRESEDAGDAARDLLGRPEAGPRQPFHYGTTETRHNAGAQKGGLT